MGKFNGLETCLYAYRDQLKSESDALVLVAHWNLITMGFQCTIDGQLTEILPSTWNADSTEYVVNYSRESKGYELKALVVEDTLIINLMKKSNERTSNVTCVTKDHVVNHKNEYQKMFINLHDLLEKMNKEFDLLLKEDDAAKKVDTQPTEAAISSSHNDPLRVGPIRGGNNNRFIPGQGLTQPYARPDDYGRSDLDPFGRIDPLRIGPGGSGGMMFDPFHGSGRPRIPGNLPPGSVPPGARFDPYGPVLPDDLGGSNPMRAGPNPDVLRPPQFDDQFM